MPSIRVTHGIDDLASDMAAIPPRAIKDMVGVVREGLKVGNSVAKDNAKRSSGKHGKHYPKSFSWEMHGAVSFGGVNGISGEYGPSRATGQQGNMSFEFGSRNQPPHLDLARSADLIGPSFAQEVGQKIDGWFW